MSGKIFDDIELTWKGQKFVVPSTNAMGLIATIEEVVEVHDLLEMIETKRYKLTVVSEAYAKALRYAGADVVAEEVYSRLFTEDKSSAVSVLVALVFMIMPTETAKKAMEEAQAEYDEAEAVAKKSQERKKPAKRSTKSRASSLSRKSSKR